VDDVICIHADDVVAEGGVMKKPVSPGETIADILAERGWTAVHFAKLMVYTPKHVNGLLHGRASITVDTAIRLEAVLGSTAQFWLARESQYREAVVRRAMQQRVLTVVDMCTSLGNTALTVCDIAQLTTYPVILVQRILKALSRAKLIRRNGVYWVLSSKKEG